MTLFVLFISPIWTHLRGMEIKFVLPGCMLTGPEKAHDGYVTIKGINVLNLKTEIKFLIIVPCSKSRLKDLEHSLQSLGKLLS